MDDDEIRRIIIRGHQKVIGHCRILLASPKLQEAERAILETRLAIEQRALNDLSGSSGDRWHRQVA